MSTENNQESPEILADSPGGARPVPQVGSAGRLSNMRRDSRGRLAGIDGNLTNRQKMFVSAYVENGGMAKQAAIVSGYSSGAFGSQLLSLPHIQSAVREARLRAIDGAACLAVGTLRDVMADDKAPASAKVQAARLALALAGHVEQRAPDGPGFGAGGSAPLEAMSVEALEQFVRAGSAAVSRMRPLVTVDQAP